MLLNILLIISKRRINICFVLLVNILFVFQIISFKNMIDMNESILFNDFILLTIYSTSLSGVKLAKEIFYEERKKIFWILIVISIIFICSFFSPKGWLYVWGGKQFIGVISFPHDACYFFSGIQSCYMALYFIFNSKIVKKICFLGNTVFMIFALLTNARTPFIISAFIFLFFIYKITKRKYITVYFLITIPIAIILIAMIFNLIDYDLLYNIPILNKFFVTIERGNITNSRDIMWSSIINSYKESFNIIDKFFGKGSYFSQSINLFVMGSPLWAHNDFLEILVCMGYYGTYLYTYSIYSIFKRSKNVVFVIILILAAFFNGVFVYRQILFFIPIITLILSYDELIAKDI